VGALSFVECGDTLLVEYQPEPNATPVRILATVRWIGRSRVHDSPGAGLAFDTFED
jgi:hypothetical protein